MWRRLVAGWRLFAFFSALLYTAADAFVRQLDHRHRDHRYRGWMLQKCGERALSAFGIKVTVHGVPPTSGLVVSNHLSYIDILALGSAVPINFVSKAEIRSWPLIGYLGESGGSILIDRSKASGVRAVNEEIAARLREGGTVGLFAEGTTSDGEVILPFRAPLFRAAATTQTPIWPVALRYTAPGYDVANEVCYWGEMTLVPHLLHLATLREINLDIYFAGEPIVGDDLRKLAMESQRAVESLLGRESMHTADDAAKVARAFTAVLR